MERSKDYDSIIFTCALPRCGVGVAGISEAEDLALSTAVLQRARERVSRRSTRNGEVGERPAREGVPERRAHAGYVLVPQHAEDGVRRGKEPHFAEVAGEHASGLRVMRDVQHHGRPPGKDLEAARELDPSQ